MKKSIFSTMRFQIVFLIFISSLLYFWKLGQGSLADFDEVIYAQMAKETIKYGDWLTMHLNGLTRFVKPPLYTWLVAFSYKIFGIGEFAARFPSALFGVLGIMVTYLLGKELFHNKEVGFLSALILLTTIGYSQMPRQAMMSTTLTFFFLLSFYFFWLGRTKSKYLIFAGLSVGLAIMVKGVIGLVPLVIIGLFLLFKFEELKKILKEKDFYIGIFMFLLVACPWHLYQFIIHKKDFINMYIFQTLAEHTSRNVQNMSFYPLTVIYSFLPWTFLGLFAFFQSFSSVRREGSHILLLSWILFPLALFTYSGNRLYWHIVPIYPALAILVGYLIKEYREKKESRLHANIFFLFSLFLLIMTFSLCLGLWIIKCKNFAMYKTYFCCVPILMILISGLGLSGILLFLQRWGKRKVLPIIPIVLIIFISIFTFAFLIFNSLNAYDTNHNIKILALKMKSISEPADKIIFYRGNSYPFIFYSDRFALRIEEEKELRKILEGEGQRYFLLEPEVFVRIEKKYPQLSFTVFAGEKDFFALAKSNKPQKVLVVKR